MAWSPGGGLDLIGGTSRFEEFEVSHAAMVGLASAAAQARRLGIDVIEATVQPLAEHLRTSLAGLPGVTVADTAARRAPSSRSPSTVCRPPMWSLLPAPPAS